MNYRFLVIIMALVSCTPRAHVAAAAAAAPAAYCGLHLDQIDPAIFSEIMNPASNTINTSQLEPIFGRIRKLIEDEDASARPTRFKTLFDMANDISNILMWGYDYHIIERSSFRMGPTREIEAEVRSFINKLIELYFETVKKAIEAYKTFRTANPADATYRGMYLLALAECNQHSLIKYSCRFLTISTCLSRPAPTEDECRDSLNRAFNTARDQARAALEAFPDCIIDRNCTIDRV